MYNVLVGLAHDDLCLQIINQLNTKDNKLAWFGLWCLTPLSTIFQLYRDGSVLLVEETGENHRPVAGK